MLTVSNLRERLWSQMSILKSNITELQQEEKQWDLLLERFLIPEREQKNLISKALGSPNIPRMTEKAWSEKIF